MARPAIALALPRDEQLPVADALAGAGFEPLLIGRPDELDDLLASRRDIALAILDGETDFDESLEYYTILHDTGREIPALMIVSPQSLDRLATSASAKGNSRDEYLTRPYTGESIRWRAEAMLIRQMTVDDGSGAVLTSDPLSASDWAHRGAFVAIFNPKGGVGKTTIAVNLAAAVVALGRKVLLVDADTVTGHIASSLGIEHVRTLVDAIIDAKDDGGPVDPIQDLVAAHSSGLRVLVLSSSPLHASLLDAAMVADTIGAARRAYEFVVVDLHPDYDTLNRAVFERADRILVPVTPDVPALRAAVQLRDVAGELGFRDKLAMIVNRANSGVSIADMERTVGMPAFASIRSAGVPLVRSSNLGRTVIDLYPKEKVSGDFRELAERLARGPVTATGGNRLSLRNFFSRQKEPVRAG